MNVRRARAPVCRPEPHRVAASVSRTPRRRAWWAPTNHRVVPTPPRRPHPTASRRAHGAGHTACAHRLRPAPSPPPGTVASARHRRVRHWHRRVRTVRFVWFVWFTHHPSAPAPAPATAHGRHPGSFRRRRPDAALGMVGNVRGPPWERPTVVASSARATVSQDPGARTTFPTAPSSRSPPLAAVTPLPRRSGPLVRYDAPASPRRTATCTRQVSAPCAVRRPSSHTRDPPPLEGRTRSVPLLAHAGSVAPPSPREGTDGAPPPRPGSSSVESCPWGRATSGHGARPGSRDRRPAGWSDLRRCAARRLREMSRSVACPGRAGATLARRAKPTSAGPEVERSGEHETSP